MVAIDGNAAFTKACTPIPESQGAHAAVPSGCGNAGGQDSAARREGAVLAWVHGGNTLIAGPDRRERQRGPWHSQDDALGVK